MVNPMIQEALSVAMKHAVATPPPSDLAWLAEAFGGKHAVFRNKIKADLERGAKELAAMRSHGSAIREQMWSAFSGGEVQSHHLDVLSWLIEAIEERAKKDAADAARRLKRLHKTTKQIEGYEPGLRPFLDELNSVVREQAREEIDERLDFALFLRALRAEYRLPSSPVASFSDAPAMTAFLKAELGV